MFIHMFLFRWKDGVEAAQKAKAKADIESFVGTIPGLKTVAAGVNLSPHGQGFELGGAMHFVDEAAYQAYVTNPHHQALLGWLMPLIDAIECDFQIPS